MSVVITFKESTSDHDQLQACILFVSCSSYSDGVVEHHHKLKPFIDERRVFKVKEN